MLRKIAQSKHQDAQRPQIYVGYESMEGDGS